MTSAREKDQITVLAQETVKRIRDFVRSQKDLWAQVPMLAIDANGRTGFCDNLSKASGCGYWAVQASVDHGYYKVYVDCATGELLSAGNPHMPAPDQDVLRLAHHIDQLDAEGIIKGLKKKAKEPYGSYYSANDRREHEASRVQQRKKIQTPYIRTQHFMPTFSLD